MFQRVNAGAIGGGHRVQWLDRDRHAGIDGMGQHGRQAVGDLFPGIDHVFRPVRQAAAYHHKTLCLNGGGFVDGAAVVVQRRLPSGIVNGGKHAAAADAGDGHAVVFQNARRFIDPAFGKLVAPDRNPADILCRIPFDGFAQRPLLHRGRLVDGELFKIRCCHRSDPYAVDGHHPAHPGSGLIGALQQTGLVRQAEYLAKMHDRSCALLAADHREMVLVTVQIGHEDHTGFVEPGRRPEDMTRQGHRRREDIVEFIRPVSGQGGQRCRRGRGDGIENPQQGIGIPFVVARDQLGVIEIVAGIHAHTVGQAAT